jgi:SAM-dependent methyltransferase
MEPSVYDLYSREEDSWWWGEGRRSLITALWQKYSNGAAKPRILEVGCGTGGLLKHLASWSTPYGADFSPQAVSLCLERGVTKVCVADTAHLPFPDDQFDAVVYVDVFEHLDDDTAGMREAYRVCRPNGRLIATVPAFDFLWSRRDVQLHHRRRYRRDGFKHLVRSEGFKILKATYVNLPLFFPLLAMVKTGMLKSGSNTRVDYALAPGPINRLLATVFRTESEILRLTDLPIGSSIACVAAKANSGPEGNTHGR